jgi:predicted TPR repeat methyltransferase
LRIPLLKIEMNRAELQLALEEAARLQTREPEKAEQTLRNLLAEHPNETIILVRLARLLHQVGRAAEAVPLMKQAVAFAPKAPLFNDLGSLLLAAGDRAAAIDAYQNSLKLDPNYALGCLNLADVLAESGRLPEAIELYRRVIAIDSSSVDGRVGLAAAFLRIGDPPAALAECRAALAIDSGHVGALHATAIALAKTADLPGAIAHTRALLVQKPRFAKGWHTLGNLLDDAGDVEQATSAYRRALQIDPDLVEATYDLAALTDAVPPPAMPRPYVTRLFDDFAPTFERRLVAELDYRVPEALRKAVALHLPSSAATAIDVLDLGCGTGLVGKQFRDLAGHITGVDLSTAMLAEARAAGVYNELVCEDVIDYMAVTESRFDLVVAADLFIYIGELGDLFAAARRVLRPDGLMAFSIETIDGSSYALRRTRRYAHSLAYIGDLARRHSMTILETRPTAIRRGDGGSVDGHIIVLRRDSAQSS